MLIYCVACTLICQYMLEIHFSVDFLVSLPQNSDCSLLTEIFLCSFQGAAADVSLSVSWWWTFGRAGGVAVQADAAGLHSGKDSSAAVTQDPAGGNVPHWQLIHEAAMAFITGTLEQVEELSVPCQFHASSFRVNTRRILHSKEPHSVSK